MKATTFGFTTLCGLVACARATSPAIVPPAARQERSELRRFPDFPARPRAGASEGFQRTWGDGRAELSGYRATVLRYGELRSAEVMLLYVTEPMNRRTWIKDDDARGDDRVGVLKLNYSLKFQTGVYPYSVMTSVFSPVDRYRTEPFAPVKVTLSAQEWCGHVFHAVWPGEDRFASQIFSYFASEGEAHGEVTTPSGTLYEDALLIQLRELDGHFANGGDWHGPLVPSLWATRRAHRTLAPVDATITRARSTLDGTPVTRFELRYGGYQRTFDVEVAEPHRVLAWRCSDGEDVRLLQSTRLAYWELNRNGDERHREALGLPLQGR
jgi:hypothetical protein